MYLLGFEIENIFREMREINDFKNHAQKEAHKDEHHKGDHHKDGKHKDEALKRANRKQKGFYSHYYIYSSQTENKNWQHILEFPRIFLGFSRIF